MDRLKYESCKIIPSFPNHFSYKYAKYKEELEHIRTYGHTALTSDSLRLVHL